MNTNSNLEDSLSFPHNDPLNSSENQSKSNLQSQPRDAAQSHRTDDNFDIDEMRSQSYTLLKGNACMAPYFWLLMSLLMIQLVGKYPDIFSDFEYFLVWGMLILPCLFLYYFKSKERNVDLVAHLAVVLRFVVFIPYFVLIMIVIKCCRNSSQDRPIAFITYFTILFLAISGYFISKELKMIPKIRHLQRRIRDLEAKNQ